MFFEWSPYSIVFSIDKIAEIYIYFRNIVGTELP